MITGTKEYLDDIAKHYVCRDDGGRVVVAWYGFPEASQEAIRVLGRALTPDETKDWGCYVLSCQHDHFPEEVTRQPSLTEMYKQGEELPEPIKSNVKKSIEKRAAMLPKAPHAFTVGGIPAADLDTGELLSLETLKALVDYAHRYGLDPARGHVALMHGKPYITIDAYLFHAKRQNVPYSLTGRPLKADELAAAGYEPADLGWYSKVTRHDTNQVFEGYGFVKRSELTQMSKKHPDRLRYPIVAEKPGNLVIKRADWQALRRAFPIGESPQGEESVDKEF